MTKVNGNNIVSQKRYSIPEVLDRIGRYNKDYNGWNVKMGSQRYLTFVIKGCSCAICGLQGSFFLLCQNLQPGMKSNRAHFNLFAEVDGELILFTKDHIVPKSKGGKNHLSNYQTMCYPCNLEKADSLEGR